MRLNSNRREEISRVIAELEAVKSNVEDLRDEEQDCLINMPENLEGSERYKRMEDAVDNLDDAVSSLEDVIESLEKASE